MCSNATVSSEKAGLQGYTENKQGGRKTLNGRPRMNEAHTYFFDKKLLTRNSILGSPKIKNSSTGKISLVELSISNKGNL